MSRIAYVNGRYLPHRAAHVHIEDRGYQFADAAYEVIAIRNGELIDEALHVKRLARSLGELRIARPMSDRALGAVMREVMRRNDVVDGSIYVQVSRGVAPRDFPFPKGGRPSVVMMAGRGGGPNPGFIERGVGVITLPDIGWARPAMKSVAP